MSDRFYLGNNPAPDAKILYDEVESSGIELRKKLRANKLGYGGPFKLVIEPGTPLAEVRAFFPEDDEDPGIDLWWPPVEEWRVYYGKKELPEPKTVEALLESIAEANRGA